MKPEVMNKPVKGSSSIHCSPGTADSTSPKFSACSSSPLPAVCGSSTNVRLDSSGIVLANVISGSSNRPVECSVS